MLEKITTIATLVLLVSAGAVQAQKLPAAANQSANIKRTMLQKFDVPGTRFETIIGIAEIAPDSLIGRHTHPGTESGYVIEGDITLMVKGQPPLPLKAGESYRVAADVVHDAKSGPKGAKIIATYIVEKGKPSVSTAP